MTATFPAFQETMDSTLHYFNSLWLAEAFKVAKNKCVSAWVVCHMLLFSCRVVEGLKGVKTLCRSGSHKIIFYSPFMSFHYHTFLLLWNTKGANLFPIMLGELSTLAFYCDQGWNRKPFLIQIHFHSNKYKNNETQWLSVPLMILVCEVFQIPYKNTGSFIVSQTKYMQCIVRLQK